jgi:hypothetical protein
MLFTIVPSFEQVPPGSYPSSFVEIQQIETSKGKAFKWVFKTEDGKFVSGLTDGESSPSPKNKMGRWLSALSGKPLASGLAVNTDPFIGKKYLCIVAGAESGPRLETFVKM